MVQDPPARVGTWERPYATLAKHALCTAGLAIYMNVSVAPTIVCSETETFLFTKLVSELNLRICGLAVRCATRRHCELPTSRVAFPYRNEHCVLRTICRAVCCASLSAGTEQELEE